MAKATQPGSTVHIVLGAASALAWLLLALDRHADPGAGVCAAVPAGPVAFAAVHPAAASLVPLLHWITGWTLMCAAMMLPLLLAPLIFVRDRSFADRRRRSMFLFVVGYWAVWMVAGLGLQVMVLAAHGLAPGPLAWSPAALVALIWQFSPAKQWALNRCHRLPALAASGAAADRDALLFGLRHAGACVAACWALMLLLMSLDGMNGPAMVAVTLFVLAERFERPAARRWTWRWPGRLLRIAVAQLRARAAAALAYPQGLAVRR